jgi:hypothetical protein
MLQGRILCLSETMEYPSNEQEKSQVVGEGEYFLFTIKK